MNSYANCPEIVNPPVVVRKSEEACAKLIPIKSGERYQKQFNSNTLPDRPFFVFSRIETVDVKYWNLTQVPPPYIYPPPTILPPSKSPQVSPPIPTCEAIPYPGMFLYKKSVEYKPALYAPTLYTTPGLVTSNTVPGLGVDFGHVHKIAKGVYGQKVQKY